MARRLLGFGFLVLAMAGVGCAQPAHVVLPAKAPGEYVNHLTVNKIPRQYILHVPKAYDATRPLPLVIILHGWTSNGSQFERYSHFASEADREGFILVAPDGLGNPPGWNVGYMDLSGQGQDDVAFVKQVLDDSERQVGVDPRRVYVAGHSNGAMLAFLVGSRLGDRVAAIAAVSGTIGLAGVEGRPGPQIPMATLPVSVMIVHGIRDRMVAYGDQSPALLKGIGAESGAKWWAKAIGAGQIPSIQTSTDKNVVTRLYSGGAKGTEVKFVTIVNGVHDWPSAAYDATDAIWQFFESHPKSG